MDTLTEGKYTLNFKVLHKELDQASTMANYIADSAILTKGPDFLTITFMLIDNQTILGFQIDSNEDWVEAINQKVKDEDNRRYELFELNDITELMTARVQYELGYEGRIIKGDEEVRLEFDIENLAPIE